jgi:large subunit ribosomal protein L14e
MALIEVGRVCIKKSGRDAGDKAVITKIFDKNFVEVMTHTRPKPRKINAKHLEFLNEKLDVKNTGELNSALEISEKRPAPETPRKK